MGTVVNRTRKDGSTAYLAQISIVVDGKLKRENKTFDREQAARIWVVKREKELNGVGASSTPKHRVTLAQAIDKYVTESRRAIGRTKTQVLRSIKTYDIAEMECSSITGSDVTRFVTELSVARKPNTVSNYLSHLGAVFAIAKPAWGYELDPKAVKDAFTVGKSLGTITKSISRERRPTLEELDMLLEHFMLKRQRMTSSPPMYVIVPFAIFSTRRQEEITRITWSDFNSEGSRILVRDMKHPGEKIGNNVRCDLPPFAKQIIEGMPRVSEKIFPYKSDSISSAFTRACKILGIKDLRFHDLRHEGVSCLFEMGLTIPRVASVSGHRSWQSLKRYTHMDIQGDKYENWKWMPTIKKELEALSSQQPASGR